MRLLLTLALAAALAPASPFGAFDGDFRGPTGAVVNFHPCGADVCLRLVQLPPDAKADTDIHNPDTALRARKLCGLDIGTGFHRDDETHLSGGHLYDPKVGHTYKGTITAAGDMLKLHGYVGISAFGRTEEWRRVPPVPPCR